MPTPDHRTPAWIWPGITAGLASAVAMWIVWYILHLPGMTTPLPISGLLIGLTLAGTSGWLARSAVVPSLAGLTSGATAGLVGLMLLGSKITQPAGEETELNPNSTWIVLSFIAICGAIGLASTLVFKAIKRDSQVKTDQSWLRWLAAISAASYLPLLTIGGFVTSSGSGMAVPDWPGTYGSNMFLYPFALMDDPRVFFEHTHRLFGTLAGITTLTLFTGTVFFSFRPSFALSRAATLLLTASFFGSFAAHFFAGFDRLHVIPAGLAVGSLIGLAAVVGRAKANAGLRGSLTVPILSLLLLLGVIVQGLLGGFRVKDDIPALGALHGVVGQGLLVLAVSIAALSGRAPESDTATTSATKPVIILGIISLVCLTIQLIFGSLYRHLGSTHALWSHVGFSLIVTGAVAHVGIFSMKATLESPAGRSIRRIGSIILAVLALQFTLGFAALGFGSGHGEERPIPTAEELETAPPIRYGRSIVATVHQANGAALAALVGLSLTISLRTRLSGKPTAPQPDAPAAPRDDEQNNGFADL